MNLRFAPTSQAILGRDGRVDAHWERWFGDLARAVNAASGSGDAEQEEPAAVSLVQGYGIAVTGAGTPDSPWVVGLRELRDSGVGASLVKITRDTYGRVSGTETATTDDLAEGDNLYFTDERVDTRVQAADYSLAGAWNFQHNITVAGMTVGLGPGEDTSNLVIGAGAAAARNTATNVIAIGARSLESNQSISNWVAIGSRAASSVTSGIGSVVIGGGALRDATSSAANVIIGGNAALLSPSLSSAVAVGADAIRNGGGTNPVAIGRNALLALISGTGNTAAGFQAGRYQTAGSGNVYLGQESGVTSTIANANLTGQNNTYLGYRSGPATPTQVSFSTAIGAEATVATSGTIVLGRPTENTVLGATGDDGSGAKLQVTGAIKATTELRIGSDKVVGARDTGWTAVSGTAQKGGGTTYTAPTISASPTQAEVQAMADALQEAHRTIKALTDALTTHGIIGA